MLEGSSLGGVILAKRVRDILGARVADEVTGYLRLRREGTKASWASFTAALAAFDARATPAERDESCVSATETFGAYARAFAESGALVRSADVEAAS